MAYSETPYRKDTTMKIVDAAKEIAKNEKVQAVVTVATVAAVTTASLVAVHLVTKKIEGSA